MVQMDEGRDRVLQRDALRLAFLRRLYDETDGSTRAMVPLDQLAEALNLGRADAARILDYLRAEGLAGVAGAGPLVEITHFGVLEVEESIRNPDRGTEHFTPAVIQQTILIGNQISNSSIAFAGGDIQQVHQPGIDVIELTALVRELAALVARLGLSEDEQRAAALDLETVEVQLRSPQPNRAVLREALKSVRTIVEGAIGGAATPEVADLVHRLAHAVDVLMH